MSWSCRFMSIFIFLVAASIASAHSQDRMSFEFRERVKKMKEHRGRKFSNQGNQRIQCGDTITVSVALREDLNCPDTRDYAIKIAGDNITVDGRGFKIRAPQAVAGIFAQGSSITLRNLHIQGIEAGSGVFAVDTERLKVQANDFSGNQMGLVLYAQQKHLSQVQIINNVIRQSQLFAIRTMQEAPGVIDLPQIRRNDLSLSGSYALHIQARRFELGVNSVNNFWGSMNGLYFSEGSLYLEGQDFSSANILRTQVSVNNANLLRGRFINLSSRLKADPSQQRIGLEVYKVKTFDLSYVYARGNDVAVRISTEAGIQTSGRLNHCSFLDQDYAGIMLTSHDGTSFGPLEISRCWISQRTDVFDLFVSPGTRYDSKSQLDFRSYLH